MSRICFVLAFVLLLLSSTMGRAADSVDPLAKQLLTEASKIMQELKDRGVKNVGVLKFRIEKGTQPVDRVGPLNGNLADRLELALILSNNAQNPVGIIHDASSVAAGIAGADHRTPDGLQKLFAAQYPLAWGTEKVSPDALLVGTAKMETGGDLNVSIFLFDNKSNKPSKLSQFKVAPTVTELAEAGESFVLRGIFDGGQVQLAAADRSEKASKEAAEKAKQIYDKPQDYHPLSPKNNGAPIGLQIQYDGITKPFEFRDGHAQIPEPNERQKVTFILSRKVNDPHTYAIVLKVNGENTIGRERKNDQQCRKWVLAPNSPAITLKGFQLDDKTAAAFRVASSQESAARAIDYGRDVGTISVVVFREAAKGLPDDGPGTKLLGPTESDAEEGLAILMRGVLPEQAGDLGTLRSKLSTQLSAKDSTRGIILDGTKIDQPTKMVEFKEDPIPVMSGVIVYYKP